MKAYTTKQLNDHVFKYIIDCIDSEGYGIETKTDAEKIKFVLDSFDSEYNYKNNKIRYPALNQRFSEWLKGLPSSFTIDFYDDDILKIAKQWRSIPEDASKSLESSIIKNWFLFITAKLFYLAGKHKINYMHLY